MSLLLRTRLIRHPPSIHALSGADATPGETRDAKSEYISRMPETTLPEPPSGPQPGRWVLSHGEIPHHRVRSHAGDVPGRPQPDHRGDRPADNRARFSRFRTPAMGRHGLSAELDRGRAAVRKAQRHSRAPRHDARGCRHLHRRFHRLRPGDRHDHADPRARAAGDRRGRHSAAGAIDSRRCGRAARTRPLPGLYGQRLGDRRAGRPGHRRHPGRAFPLVDHLLVQRPARPDRGGDGAAKPQAPAAPRAQAQARPARCRPDDGCGHPAPAGAHLGRNALSLAVCSHCRADPGLGGAVGPVRVAVAAGRPNRSCRCPSSPIR